MNRLFSFTKRNIKEIWRDPISLVFLYALPILMLILFYCIFHQLTPQFEMRYLSPSMIGFAHAFIALFASMLVSTDRGTAFITRLYSTPLKPREFYGGYLLSVLPFGIIQTLVILLIGGIFDPSLFSIHMIFVLLASIISIIMFASIGILLGTLLNAKAVGGVCSIVICGQSILSGMWFPIEGMPKGFLTFMNCLPFRNGAVLFQNISSGVNASFFDIWCPLLVLVLYGMVFFTLSLISFTHRTKER